MEKAHTADPGILWRQRNIHSLIQIFEISVLVHSATSSSRGSPVHLCGEHAHHRGNPVDVDDVGDRLEHVEVEDGLPRHGAVQPRFHKRRPVLL